MAKKKISLDDFSEVQNPELIAPTDLNNEQTDFGLSDWEQYTEPTTEEYTGFNLDEFSDYDEGISYQQAISEGGFERNRHEEQPWYASLGAAANQAIVGEIAGGTIEGIGYLLDVEQYANLAKGTEQEFGNWFSDLGKEMKTWASETTPIYADPNKQGEFSPEDWTWWMTNLPSVASTLSLMIPAAGAVKGLSAIGKGMGLAGKMGKTASWMTKGVSQAVISRHMENMMEASGTAEELRGLAGTRISFDQAMDIKDNYGVELLPTGFDDTGNAIYEINEEVATEISAKAASNIYKANWAMLAQDIPQYLLLNKPFGKVTEDLTVGLAKKLGKNAVPVVANKAKAIGLDMIGEGSEEAYQFIVGERSKELALADAGLVDKRDLSDAVKEYASKGDFWTSAFFGAMGAGFMQTAGKPVNNLINRVKGVESENERRMKDVDQWGKRMESYTDMMAAAEAAGNEEMFATVQEAALIDMGTKAAENGNLGYMTETLSKMAGATEEDQEMFGITPEMMDKAKKSTPDMIDSLNRVGELYQANLNKFGKETAGILTQQDYRIESLNKDLGTVNSKLGSTISSIPNFGNMSGSFQKTFSLGTEIESKKNVLAAVNKKSSETKDSDIKKHLDSRVKALEGNISLLENELSSIDYTKEEKATDKQLDITSPSVENYVKLSDKKAFTEEGLASSQEYSRRLKSPSGQNAFKKKTKAVEKASIIEAATNAANSEELIDTVDRVAGTEHEATADEAINEQANVQAANQNEEMEDFPDIDPADLEGVTMMNKESEDAATTSDFAKKRYYDKEGNQLPQLFVVELENLKSTLSQLEGGVENKLLLNQLNNVSTVEQFDDWLSTVLEYKANGRNVDAIANAINDFYIDKRTDVYIAEANKEALSNIGVDKSEIRNEDTSDGIPIEEVSTEETLKETISEVPESTKYKINRSNNGRTMYINHSPSVENSTAVNNPNWVPGLDVNGLNNGDYKIGDTIHFEVDKTDDFSKDSTSDRAFRMVIYKDGNPDNKSKANRKIVGNLGRAASERLSSTKAKITRLREDLFSDVESKYGQDSNIVTSKYTSRVAGYKVDYSRTDLKQSPLNVVRAEDSSIPEMSRIGGFGLGLTRTVAGKREVYYPKTGIATHNNNAKYDGQIMVITQNPLAPEHLVLRGFIKKLGDYTVQNEQNGNKIKETVINEFKKINPDGSNFKEVINNINQFLYSTPKYNPQTQTIELDGKYSISIEDLIADNLDQLNKYLDGLHFSISKDDINSARGTYNLGYGLVSGSYNALVNDFIELDTKPKQYFDNAALLISLDINQVTEKAAKKTEPIAKEIVSDNKEYVQPEIYGDPKPEVISEQEDSVVSDTTSKPKKKRSRKRFDTGLGDSSQGLKDNANRAKNMPKSRLATGDFTPWNKKQELDWLNDNFPGVAVKDITAISNQLKEILKSGQQAWGAYYNSAIYLANNAAQGTAYHEAFHAIFHLSLNDKQRKQLLANAKGKDAIAKEEYLADEFMDYVISSQENKSLHKSIRDWFRKAWLMIKSVFTDKVSGVEEFAFRANNGFYAKPSVEFGKFESSVLRTRINGWSYKTEKAAIEAVNMNLLTDVIPNLRSSNSDFTNMEDAEIMSVISKDKGNDFLYKQVYNNFLNLLEEDNSGLTEEQEGLIEDLLDFLFESEDTPGKLYSSSVKALDYNNGIKVSQKKVSSTKEDTGAEITDNEDGVKENWQSEYTQRSSKNTAPYEIKKFVRYLETGNKNDFGLTEYVNYDDAYNGLLADLAGVTSLDELKTNLGDMAAFNPYYSDILERINNDAVFASKFFNTFSVTHSKYALMFEKDGSYILTDSNRRGIVKTIVTDWTNNVLVNSDIVALEKDGSYIIDTEKAAAIKDEYGAIVVKRELDATDLSRLSAITKSLGFEIPEKVFAHVDSQGINYLFLTGQKSLQTIVNKFAEGKNPFDSDAGLETTEADSINLVARFTKKAMPQLFESSFKNINGQSQYSHLVPNFLSKLVNRLHRPDTAEAVINEYQKDNLFQNNIILNELYNLINTPDQLSDAFDFSIVDGINDSTGRKGYPDMTKSDLQTMSINAYFNNGNKNYSYYRGPVLSDAGNMLLFKFKRFKADVVIHNMVNLAAAEYVRIQRLKEASGLGIKNYDTALNASTETGYSIMPMFNGFEGNPLDNTTKAEKVITDWFADRIDAYKESLFINGILVKTDEGNIDYEKSRIDKRLSDRSFDEFISEFYYNDFLMRANFSLLTVGDPAFYKPVSKEDNNRVVDYTKRAKEIYSPKFIPNTDATYVDENGVTQKVQSIYNTIYLTDAEIPAPSLEGITKVVNDMVKDGTMSKSQGIVIKSAYKEVNQTDAQAYITLPFYRETMASLGRWTDKHIEAYPRLLAGKGTAQDIALVMQPLKPFMYTQIWNSEIQSMMPVQNKNSEYLLLAQLTDNNPDLKKISDHMMDNNIGVVNFESAVKAGLYGKVGIDNLGEAVVHAIPMEDRGIQMETPEHFRDSNNLFGSQIRKLIMSDLTEGVDYDVNGWKSVKAKELYEMYESIIMEDLKESYEDVYGRFTEDGKVNWKKVHELLLDEARSRGKGEEFEKAIEYDEANDRLKLPLFHPLYANTAENLLTSLFKNNVTKQKIAGGAFIQATGFGLSKELKLNFSEDGGLDHAEILLPAWSKEFYKDFVTEDGIIDFEQVEKSAPELLEMIGYRIPTEDKYSMLPLKVVGFLPLEGGGAVMLPAEITTISGSDFDVDKMYIMMKAFTRSKKGEYNVDKMDYSEGAKNNKSARNNAKIDLMMSVLRNRNTIPALLTPGGFDNLQDIAKLINKKSKRDKESMDVFSVSTADEMATRNMTGMKLVGIAANHNAHHALRQNFDLELTGEVMFDGKTLSKLGGTKAQTKVIVKGRSIQYQDSSDINISRNLSEFLAAVVDNAKDPVAAFVNYNSYTADTISLITSLGFDPATAIFFATQPVILELTKRVMDNPDRSSNSIMLELSKEIDVDFESGAVDLGTTELFNAIGSEDLATPLQKKVLIAFETYGKYGKDLGKLIRASRADTKGLGPTMADGESIISVIEDVSQDGFGIKGASEMFNSDNMIQAFTDYGVIKPMDEVMNNVLPYASGLYNAIKNSINYYKESGDLSVDKRNSINRQIMSFYLSGFDFFNEGERSDLVTNLPTKFFKYLEEHPEMKDNALFKRIKFQLKTKSIPIDTLSFNNSVTMTDEQRVAIQSAFEDLLDDSRSEPHAVKMANDLLKYSYFTSGMNFTAHSFAHIIPVDAYLNYMRDSSGKVMTDYMYNLESIANDESVIDQISKSFTDQYYRNNYRDKSIVSRVNEDKSNISQILGNDEVILISKDVADKSLAIKDGQAYNPMPFIAQDLENSTILYTFVGTDSDGFWRYIKTNKLGVPNYVVEYNMNMFNMESIIPDNNVNPIATENMFEAQSQSETNDSEALKEAIPSNKSAEELSKRCKGNK